MSRKKFSSVWDAIEDTPQQAASMRARSALMIKLAEVIREQKLTQAAAARLFGVTQPRISDLVRGKINLFSLDMLIDMSATAGLSPQVVVRKPNAVKKRVAGKDATRATAWRSAPLRRGA